MKTGFIWNVTTPSAAHCEGGNEGPAREKSQVVFMIEQISVSYPCIQRSRQSSHPLLLFVRIHQNAKSFISQHRQSRAENTAYCARNHLQVSKLFAAERQWISLLAPQHIWECGVEGWELAEAALVTGAHSWQVHRSHPRLLTASCQEPLLWTLGQ